MPYTDRPVSRTFQEACPALDAADASKEKLLAMAIVIYCGVGFDSAPVSSNAGLASRTELSRMLLQYEWEPESRDEVSWVSCLFWMWMVAISSWQTSSGRGLLPRGVELLLMLQRRFERVKEWTAVEDILVAFPWNERLTTLCKAEFERVRS